MSTIFDVAAEVEEVCVANEWPFCIIGGVAVQRWAEPRATADVDVTILTGFGGEAPVVEHLLERFSPRIQDAEEFALAPSDDRSDRHRRVTRRAAIRGAWSDARPTRSSLPVSRCGSAPPRSSSSSKPSPAGTSSGRTLNASSLARERHSMLASSSRKPPVLLEVKGALDDLALLRSMLGR